jgi:conjugative transposon TraN protein
LRNNTNVTFEIDYITFRIVDKKVVKRTAIQEQVIVPLRGFNQVTHVSGRRNERTVFALPKFTIPNDKQLIIELAEKDGGRSQILYVENSDLVRAKLIDNLKMILKLR